MQSIQQTLKNAAVNGRIDLSTALKIATAIDAERADTVQLLKSCEKNVGMVLGEDINAHVAKMTGGYFSAQEYHHERLPGEQ